MPRCLKFGGISLGPHSVPLRWSFIAYIVPIVLKQTRTFVSMPEFHLYEGLRNEKRKFMAHTFILNGFTICTSLSSKRIWQDPEKKKLFEYHRNKGENRRVRFMSSLADYPASPGSEIWRHFRFSDVTPRAPMLWPGRHFRCIPSLVENGQFLCPLQPNKYVQMTGDVTSGLAASLRTHPCSSSCLTLGPCQVWLRSKNSSALYSWFSKWRWPVTSLPV